jgi:hypothetical protein
VERRRQCRRDHREAGPEADHRHGAIEKIIDEVLAANQKSVEEFRAGKEKAFNALVGSGHEGDQGQGQPAAGHRPAEEKTRRLITSFRRLVGSAPPAYGLSAGATAVAAGGGRGPAPLSLRVQRRGTCGFSRLLAGQFEIALALSSAKRARTSSFSLTLAATAWLRLHFPSRCRGSAP